MTDSAVNERLQAYFSKNRISMAEVSRQTGIQYDTLQQILYGRVKAMGVDKFTAIWKAYPDLDAWYILTGQIVESTSRTTDMKTVEELKAFKEEMDQAIEKRIQELGG